MDRGTWLCKRPGVAISSTASVALSASRLCKSWCPGAPVWDPNGSAVQIGKNKVTIHEQHEKSNKNQQHVSHAMKRSPPAKQRFFISVEICTAPCQLFYKQHGHTLCHPREPLLFPRNSSCHANHALVDRWRKSLSGDAGSMKIIANRVRCSDSIHKNIQSCICGPYRTISNQRFAFQTS